MNTQLDPNKISQILTQSTRQLDETTLTALEKARHNALKSQSRQSPVFALTASNWMLRLMPHSSQQWAATGLLAAVLIIGTGYWQYSTEQQISELDVAILTDELPIEVFISQPSQS